nr:hypothetical protein GCM10017745_42300 [Saccharothrix mutabilis subsp. capreolus]
MSGDDTAAPQHFELGPFALDSGYTLPGARLAYRTFGELNAARDNAVLFPHMYSGNSSSLEALIGEGRALDPSRYFIVLPDQFGNGLSSSPSNTPPPFDRGQFPVVSIADDVRAQHRLVTEHFGITALHAVVGWSMGGQQAYEWAVRHPRRCPGRRSSPRPPGPPRTTSCSSTWPPNSCARTPPSPTGSTPTPPTSTWASSGTRWRSP